MSPASGMNIPKALSCAPDQGNWGFVASWIGDDLYDRHESRWFEGPFEMACAVCLEAEEYVRTTGGDMWERVERIAACEGLFLQTFRAFRSGDPAKTWEAFSAVHGTWGVVGTLEWCGPFQDLLEGEGAFAVRLRGRYFEERGLVRPPRTIPDHDVDDFAEWVCGFEGFLGPWAHGVDRRLLPSR